VSASQRRRARGVTAALLLGGLTLGLRAPLFDLPLERDEGEYAYIGWRLLAGDTPYLDWLDQKPPAIFVPYALAIATGEDPVVAIRLGAALFCAASVIALFALVRRLRGETEAWLAGALLAVLSADGAVQGPIANSELFMGPWILLALLGTLRVPARARPPAAAGLAIGACLAVACAFKQVAAVNAPLLLAVFWLRTPAGQRGPGLLRFAFWTAAGGVLVVGAIAAWFAARGGLGAALDAVLLHNLAYAAWLDPAQRLALWVHHASPMLPSQGVAWALAGGGLLALAWRRERLTGLVLAGFAATSAIGVSASGLYFPHYFQQALPAVAALAAVAVTTLCGALPARLRGWALVAGAGLALVPPGWAVLELSRLPPAEATRRLYPGSAFEAMPAVAAEVASLTGPDERIFVFGAEPELYFHARRLSASRYIFLFPLYGDFPQAEGRQAEVIAELERSPPAVIVWIPNRMFYTPGSPQRLTEWTTRTVDGQYRLHAWAAVEGASRGVVTRLGPDEDPRARLAEVRPWATIFVRARDAAAPTPVSP
jgi:4-amino-4-deoxy-L-arabinose transferase-like glycosyltransferase